MENYVFDEDSDSTEKVVEDSLESSEEGFMRGYSDDEESKECAECGSAINEENKVEKELEGEKITFCSQTCAEEFVENL